MEELIKITENEKGVKLVSAKELYQYLEIKTDFSDWCKRMFAYGFDEGKDFTSFLGESNGGRPSTDYALTIDTAKEISMLQRTSKGKEARQYFIEMEKIAKGLLNPILSRLQMSEYWFQAETKIIQLAQKIEQDAPKIKYIEEVLSSINSMPITVVAKELGMSSQALNKILHKMGIIYRVGATWYLYAKYQHMGYTETNTHICQDGHTEHNTKWTEKGRQFIHNKINPQLVLIAA